jgi:hypothetical protein
VGADTTAFRIARDRPSAVAYLDPVPAVDDVTDEVLEHLSALISSVRARITVGERLLWGDVAASLAVIFRAVEGAVATRDERLAVRARADAFFDRADETLGGLGSFELVDGPGHDGAVDGWFWARTNCCLWYRTSDGRLCDDCSLLDADDRRRQWRDQLSGATP